MCKARKKDISKINDKVLKHITRYSTTITTKEVKRTLRRKNVHGVLGGTKYILGRLKYCVICTVHNSDITHIAERERGTLVGRKYCDVIK